MKTSRFLVLLLAAFLTMLVPRPAQAQSEVSFDFFYDSLAPYGEWIEIADYGSAWRPLEVDDDWAPYTDGYWAFTDAGWTWVSYEDFGGIVYHYGRWVRVEDEGWCWVPDYEWAPAWVSWRQNDDYVGWAPLPPEARWSPSIGISVWVDRQYDIGPGYYSFCRVRDFGAPVLRPVIVNRRDNVTIIRRTVNITNITYNTTYVGGPVIYNGGPTYATINQRSSRRIPALKLVRDADFRFERRGEDNRRERRNDFNARAVGNQLVVSAPTVRPPTTPDWMKGKTKKVVAADKVTRGWSGVRSEEVRTELRQEMQKQTKGRTPETAPARPMAKTDVQAVPAKADPQATSPVAATPERRDRPGKNERVPDPAAPAAVVQPMPPTTAEERPPEKIPRDRDRGPGSKEPSKPVIAVPDRKPFNPVAETEPKREPAAMVPAPVVVPEAPKAAKEPPVAMPEPRQRPGRTAEQPEPKTRERETAEQKRPQAPEADREKMRGNSERPVRDPAEVAAQQAEAQRKAEFMRLQQEQQKAAQKQKAEIDRATRQQAEVGAAQRKQAEMQQRAVEEAGRAQAVEKGRAQEMETRRRQQSEQQAVEQQRRQGMEQQRAAQEAARQQSEKAATEQRRQQERGAMEQNRRQQEAPREQPRQQPEAPRPPREMQPPPQPVAPPAAAPGNAPAEPEKERRGRDKDKGR